MRDRMVERRRAVERGKWEGKKNRESERKWERMEGRNRVWAVVKKKLHVSKIIRSFSKEIATRIKKHRSSSKIDGQNNPS